MIDDASVIWIKGYIVVTDNLKDLGSAAGYFLRAWKRYVMGGSWSKDANVVVLLAIDVC